MKLSEAIRLGAMLKPQAFGSIHDVSVATCANNAAMDAINNTAITMSSAFPITGEPWTACPACGIITPPFRFCANVAGNVAHLNDNHRWTREQIAEWVATIEPKEAAKDASLVNALIESPKFLADIGVTVK